MRATVNKILENIGFRSIGCPIFKQQNIQLKTMKISLKSSAIALVSILTSVMAIHGNAQATTPIGCQEQFIKDFTVVPYFTNTTNKVIPAGTKIIWKTYWAGQYTGQKQAVLPSNLAPHKTFSTGIQFSGDSNSCKAYF